MAIGNKCNIDGCEKFVTQRKHATCSMHFSRKRRTGSYDLIPRPKVGDKIVKICSIHGGLTIDQVRETYKRRRYGKDVLPYPYMDAYCKICRDERIKVSRLKRNYGLTPEQVKEMHTKQNGLCASCGEEEKTFNKNGKRRKLCIDHDHATGLPRELLCSQCNVGIGMLQDSTLIVEKALNYLRRHKAAK